VVGIIFDIVGRLLSPMLVDPVACDALLMRPLAIFDWAAALRNGSNGAFQRILCVTGRRTI